MVIKFKLEQTDELLVEHGQTILFYCGNDNSHKNLIPI